MTHLLPSKSSTLKQKRLIKKYRDRSLRLLEKINPSEKRGVYHQSEGDIYRPLFLARIKTTGLFVNCARTLVRTTPAMRRPLVAQIPWLSPVSTYLHL